jgi:hypothetical protein
LVTLRTTFEATLRRVPRPIDKMLGILLAASVLARVVVGGAPPQAVALNPKGW